MSMKAGEQFGGWRADQPLGEGGAGEVWRCVHVETGSTAALKVLKGEAGREEKARFRREMMALEKLQHDAIVRLLDSGFGKDDHPWLVMELVDGEDLEKLIPRGPMPLEDCLTIFASLAEGLAHAHGAGVHHRDVKASNVVVRPDGRAVLVDFGAAIETDSTGVTSAGLVMGTFSYMPPEVLTGGTREPELGDIYAFGQLLYEALVGKLVFRGEDESSAMVRWNQIVAEKLDSDALDPGEGYPQKLRQIVMDATQIEPEDRIQKMSHLAERLAAMRDGHVTPAPARRQPRPSKVAAGSTPGPVARVGPSLPAPLLMGLAAVSGLLAALVVNLIRSL